MQIRHYFFLVILFIPSFVRCQDYAYTQYSPKNGLPGTNVYYIYQDIDGFMWFATDAGVCRYDGSRYKVFTLADGIPDIEIFGIHHDSNDRIWMLPFKKSICFYKEGKFYTPENTPYLKNIHVKNRLYGIIEDTEKNIWLYEDSFLYKISSTGEVTTISKIDGIPIENCAKISRCKAGGIILAIHSGLYQLKNNKLKIIEKYQWPLPPISGTPLRHVALTENTFVNLGYAKSYKYKYNNFFFVQCPDYPHNISIVNDSIFFVCTPKGSYRYSFTNPSHKAQSFFSKRNVGCVYQDREANLWFSVLGEGLYKLSSPDIKHFKFSKLYKAGSPVTFIKKEEDNTYLCTSPGKLLITKNFTQTKAVSLDSSLHDGYTWPCKIKLIKKTPNNKFWIVIDDDGIEKYTMNFKQIKKINIPIKTIFDPPDNKILITSFAGLYEFNEDRFELSRVLWNERTTTVFKSKDSTIYVGTLNGLFILNEDGSHSFLGDQNRLFKQRPSTIAEMNDGSILLGTYGNGLTCFNGKEIKFHINEKNGLSNNIITAIIPIGNEIWVGTTNGLNKILLSKNNYTVTKFNLSDGLISTNIDNLFFKKDTLYVGTTEGINFFNIRKLNRASVCELKVTRVLINGKVVALRNAYEIKPHEKDFRVEFAGLSFKSETGTRYKYRLGGPSETWETLTQNSLQLASLPYGQFTLELIAINQYGVISKPVCIHLDVFRPFYKTYLFIAAIFLISITIAISIVYWRTKRVRNRERQKELLNTKIIQLEQFALQAQMNPHFIFNCLSSLQHYIYESNIKEGNRLLTRFAGLIRQTLDNSSQIFITLTDEIKYLSSYLEVEQIRFDNKFKFDIRIGDGIRSDHIKLPNMILQPFIENSLKHGIPHSENGKIEISFYADGDQYLFCTVRDNGIGRDEAELHKINRGHLYKSKGLSVTSQRINMLNSISNNPIKMTIKDLHDTSGKACGTEVIIKIPLNLNLKY